MAARIFFLRKAFSLPIARSSSDTVLVPSLMDDAILEFRQEVSTAEILLASNIHSDISLPSFMDIMSLCRPTLKYIPRADREKFRLVLNEALSRIVQDPSNLDFCKKLMLSQCVLPSSKRAGKKNKKLTSVSVWCDQWARGDWQPLWEAAQKAGIHQEFINRLPNFKKTEELRFASAIVYG